MTKTRARLTHLASPLFVIVLSTALSAAEPSPLFDQVLRQFLDAHCVSCHGADTKKGGLDLETLSTDITNPTAFDRWVKVHDRVKAGEMPPRKRKSQPTVAERDASLKLLYDGLVKADQARRREHGRVVLRRLNRTEYENTLRDLLGMPGLAVKELLPDDAKVHGFDKSSAALDLSYVQLAKYMEAADAALDAAIALHAERPFLYKVRTHGGGTGSLVQHTLNGEAVFLKDFKYDPSVMPLPNKRALDQTAEEKAERQRMRVEMSKNPYQGTLGFFRTEDPEFKPLFPFTAAYAGKYKLRMSVWSFWWDKGEVKPHTKMESASLVADGRTLGYFDAPSLKPTITEVEVYLKAGDRIQFNAASLWPVQLYARKGLATEFTGPGIAVDWLDIEGPIHEIWPPVSHRRLFGDLPLAPLVLPKGKNVVREPEKEPKRPKPNVFNHRGIVMPKIEFSTVASENPEANARKLLADFLPRAFRRPVDAAEVERYLGLFKSRFEKGYMFEVAMRAAYRVALCSPDFLYLREPAGTAGDRAVAARLSYFLWNSTPDAELTTLAEKGKFKDPTVRGEQVARMLKDPRSERFYVDFTDQWLDLADIDSTTPDKKLYPEFRRDLRDAMLAETRAFFRELLEKDLGVSNLVHSDFAMLNQRLAEQYRIPGVDGSSIRRVTLPADCGRGGLLTQASVLKVTANGTVTSPVKRGAWVQRKIVGQPPEPPPPDVPAIEPDVQGTTTVREMLAKHRSNAACAACHNKIDPPGFALESYDVIGGRQTHYRSLGDGPQFDRAFTFGRGVMFRMGPKVDAAGETAAGRAFEDIDGFKKLLLEDPRLLARNLVNQWVVYATGAPVGFADRAEVEKILDRAAEGRYGVRSLLVEFVRSPLFVAK